MWIKEMRIKCQLTQSELAEALGVHQTAVSQWESGITQPKASMLPKLLETLKCKFDEVKHMTTAEKIKSIRKEKGLTQKALGERLGVSQATVGQYENNPNPPKIDTLGRIAEALGVPLIALIGESNLIYKEDIKMATQISNENLRQLCIKNGWFTEGSIRQYDRLFYANENGCPIEEIATIIWVCSNSDKHCRRDILFALKEASIPESADENITTELPCKVGDKIYQTDGVRIYENEVTAILFDTHGIAFADYAIGKTVFLTRAEAEKALKEASK